MILNENTGCLLGWAIGLLTVATRVVFRGIVWILSLYLAWVIVKPEGLGTGVLFFVLWVIMGALVEFAVPLFVAIITNALGRKPQSAKLETVIYSQPNWHDDFHQILAVEVPLATHDLISRHASGRLSKMVHIDVLRHRYRRLAEETLAQSQKLEEFVSDFLGVVPPPPDPDDITNAIMNSEAFR